MRKNGNWISGRRAKKLRICDFPFRVRRFSPCRRSGVLFTVGKRGPDRDFRSDLQKHCIFVQLCILWSLARLLHEEI